MAKINYGDWRETFASNLRHIMEVRNITITQLAEALGIYKSNVCFYLSGGCVPKLATLIQMCEYLNVRVDTLLKERK